MTAHLHDIGRAELEIEAGVLRKSKPVESGCHRSGDGPWLSERDIDPVDGILGDDSRFVGRINGPAIKEFEALDLPEPFTLGSVGAEEKPVPDSKRRRSAIFCDDEVAVLRVSCQR